VAIPCLFDRFVRYCATMERAEIRHIEDYLGDLVDIREHLTNLGLDLSMVSPERCAHYLLRCMHAMLIRCEPWREAA
jgi:hypothetical protein